MSDYRERACTECGSLLHHEDDCPGCRRCGKGWSACACAIGPAHTPVPVTEVPDSPPECPNDQFAMETLTDEYRQARLPHEPDRPREVRVGRVGAGEILNDIADVVPADEAFLIPEGHGEKADPGLPPIKPDPERERLEMEAPSELSDAEIENRFRSGELRRSSCGMILSRDQVHEGCEACEMVKPESELDRYRQAVARLARARGPGALIWRERDPDDEGNFIVHRELLDLNRVNSIVQRDPVRTLGVVERGEKPSMVQVYSPLQVGKSAEEFHRWFDEQQLAAVRVSGVNESVWPRVEVGPESLSFDQQYCNIPPGHTEMPCGRVFPDADAAVHTDCEECGETLWRSDTAQVEKSLEEQIRDAYFELIEVQDSDVLCPDPETVVRLVQQFLGREVLSCAFCGEEYRGEKPVPRARLAAHVRVCEVHPLARENADLRRQLESLKREFRVAQSVSFDLAQVCSAAASELHLEWGYRRDMLEWREIFVGKIREIREASKE